MTPEAEALREKLDHLTYQGCHVPIDERVGAVARTIVEELGITGECSCELSEPGQCVHATRRELAAFTLLELAGVNHGE